MKVIVCLDDKNGMLFYGRRQSRDRVLLEDMMNEAHGARIWMNAYSAGLFEKTGYAGIAVDEDFLEKADAEEYCFAEDQGIKAYQDRIEEILVYRWNRTYPADLFLDVELSGWDLTETVEFAGSSHEKITRERYRQDHVRSGTTANN